MRALLVGLAFALMVLCPGPALSQTDPSGAQYDQYGDTGSGVGGNVVHDAIKAWGAIRATSEDAQVSGGDSASAAELPGESGEQDAAPAGEEGTELASGPQVETTNTAEAQDVSANTTDLTKLPQTGGPSPLWFGIPLVCVGVLLARKILFSQ